MSAVPKAKLTAAEYLAIEQQADFKSEFYDGEMFAMAGASREHNYVISNLEVKLGARLMDGPCRTLSRDQRVMVEATGLYVYPDIVILRGEGEFDPVDRDTLVNPKAVIEVLCPSTERYDRGMKKRHYQRIPSLVEYVLVSQDEPLCERYTRQADGAWLEVTFKGLDAGLELTCVTARVPLADVYRGVTFPDAPPK